ncbi:hypothetical protein HK101_004628, partial [Irineochytrium annulatum]
MQMFVMIYVCACEGIMFILCQYKIVSTHGTGGNKETFLALWMPYLKAALRCIGFLSTVILQMLTLTNFVYSETNAWSFVCYNPVLLSMIMLTDAARVQDLIDRLNQNLPVGKICQDAEEALAKATTQSTQYNSRRSTFGASADRGAHVMPTFQSMRILDYVVEDGLPCPISITPSGRNLNLNLSTMAASSSKVLKRGRVRLHLGDPNPSTSRTVRKAWPRVTVQLEEDGRMRVEGRAVLKWIDSGAGGTAFGYGWSTNSADVLAGDDEEDGSGSAE